MNWKAEVKRVRQNGESEEKSIFTRNEVIVVVALLTAMVAVLSGCAGPEPVAMPYLQERPRVAVPMPRPITRHPVRWQVMNVERVKALVRFLDENPEKQKDFAIYVLDNRNFEALLLNLNELKRYIQEQREALNFTVAVLEGQGIDVLMPDKVRLPAAKPKPANEPRR